MYKKILNELISRGYDAELHTVTKNGIEKTGVIIKEVGKNAFPVIYLDSIIANAGIVEKIANEVVEIHNMAKRENLDLSLLTDSDYLSKNVRIGFQRKGIAPADILKQPCADFPGLEMYIYLKVENFRPDLDGMASINLSYRFLEISGISEIEIWSYALENTKHETLITSMNEMLGALGAPNMYIISNKNGLRGAANILDRKALRTIAEKLGVDRLVAIPSSIHEFILIPFYPGLEVENLIALINEVNENEVDPVEQLGNRPYILENF